MNFFSGSLSRPLARASTRTEGAPREAPRRVFRVTDLSETDSVGMSRNASRALLVALSMIVVGCGGGNQTAQQGQAPAVPPAMPAGPTTGITNTATTASATDLEKEATKAGYEAGLKHGGDLYKAEQAGDEAPDPPENPYEGDCGSGSVGATDPESDTASVDATDPESDTASVDATVPESDTASAAATDPESDAADGEDGEDDELTPPDTAGLDTATCAKLAKIWQDAFDEAVPKGKKIAEDNLGEGTEEDDGAPLSDTGTSVESAGDLPEGFQIARRIKKVSHLKEKSGSSTVLKITAEAEVPSTGYSSPTLSLSAEPKLDEDGTLRLQFSAKPPAEGSNPTNGTQTVTAEFTFTGEVDKVKTIEVKAANNISTTTVSSG